MFFPCTNRENIVFDYGAPLKGWRDERKNNRAKSHQTHDQRYSSNLNQTMQTATNMLVNTADPDIENSTISHEPDYLNKPTIIMCSPNALYYQQMVTSPNAYWLNFFLRRDINVVCWNYRGYGESDRATFECLSPYKSKQDVEYVMAYLVNRIKVRGKIGVYGRSIGGITACHLAQKYQDLV